MDAATLRLILVVIGALFLIALYLWERRRAAGAERPRARSRSRRRAPPPPKRSTTGTKYEPNIGRFIDDELDQGGSALGYAYASETGAAGTAPQRDWDDQESYDDDADEGASEPAEPARDELLIQLYITSAGGAFAGDEILSAAERCNLQPGEMDIFHRTRGDEPDGEPLFSMANLVKPGTFPFDDMSEFASPGLAVFGQFRGEPSDLMVFDEMLDAARVMAELLGGDIRGPRREPLRDADAKALRARVRALLHGGD
jgi:cell division protein ZipA